MLHYLIYLSSSSFLYTDEDIRDILDVSRKNNEELGITGLLLYHDGTILQILEGEEEVINSLYNVIALDPRHSNAYKIAGGALNHRQCNGWSMAFKQMSPADWNKISNIIRLDKNNIRDYKMGIDNVEMVTMISTFLRVNMERNVAS